MNVRCIFLSSVAVLAMAPSAAAIQAETMPIDRWLIADPFDPDTASSSQLEVDLLDAPGEPGVLPDRGLPASGAIWHLHRHDGESAFSLDSLQSNVRPGTIAYAHVYVRLPEDRTLRFTWDGDGCTAGRAWLNGRAIAGDDVLARFGAGWNTILLKLEAGHCAFGYKAMLVVEQADGLKGVRLQASRPPGEIRTGPEDWIIPETLVRVSPERRWSSDRLFAALEIGLTGWGRSPISNVEVELEGVADGNGEAIWLTPGESDEVMVPVRLDRLQRILDAGFVASKISWEGTRIERQLTVSATPPEFSDTIALDGWTVNRDAHEGQGPGIAGQIPNAAGWSLKGEWKIPEALAGQTLILRVDGASAEYLLNGAAMDLIGGAVTLCAPCSKGTKLSLTARTTEAWDTMPVVRVSRNPD
ncbi:MAG: hypothetical protein E4H28_02990 [Gemmatimonadales bacterium]|nr:MAG: hypothetical protein E4H28_02990 [Gemmatimonadales bacterium]